LNEPKSKKPPAGSLAGGLKKAAVIREVSGRAAYGPNNKLSLEKQRHETVISIVLCELDPPLKTFPGNDIYTGRYSVSCCGW
jgi:hypothetical protein